MEGKYRDVLRKFPLPVTVVTVGRGLAENALTVSWTTPVSFEPLQMMIAVDRRHYSVDFLKSTKSFVINVLGAEQKKLAGHFARQSFTGEDKFAEIPTEAAPSGAAILKDALAYFDCELVSQTEAGNHVLFIGEVIDAKVLRAGDPLVTTEGIHYLDRGI